MTCERRRQLRAVHSHIAKVSLCHYAIIAVCDTTQRETVYVCRIAHPIGTRVEVGLAANARVLLAD